MPSSPSFFDLLERLNAALLTMPGVRHLVLLSHFIFTRLRGWERTWQRVCGGGALGGGASGGSASGGESADGPSSPPPVRRGISAYTSDLRSFPYYIYVPVMNVFIVTAIYMAIVQAIHYDQAGITNSAPPSSWQGLFSLSATFGYLGIYAYLVTVIERKYDNYISIVLLILRFAVLVRIVGTIMEVDGGAPPQGNLVVATNIILMYGLWAPMALRQLFIFNILEILLGLLRAAYYRLYGYDVSCLFILLPCGIFLMVIFWTLEYCAIVSYVIEHILVPEAQELYRKEYTHARGLLHAFTPNIAPEKGSDLYFPRRYRNCAVLAIHVKAADVLPGLVDVSSVATFMKEIAQIIETCVRECGLVNATNYSGIFIAAYPELSDDHSHVNYTTRTVACLREIQAKLDSFSRRNGVNVAIGVGMASGPVTMGFLGGVRFSFDISGSAVDLALSMASHQSDGIFTTEVFGQAIQNCQLPDDLIVRNVSVTARGGRRMTWLQIEGAFNRGMQLDDFEYMQLLGRGGYGSVHLVWENNSGKEYAVKAIHRKKNSAIPKMIQREFIILQQIQHANVVSFKFCIINKAMIYLVMKYIPGGNLKEIVDKNKPGLDHLRLWFAELVLALDYIHSMGIIHRDVSFERGWCVGRGVCLSACLLVSVSLLSASQSFSLSVCLWFAIFHIVILVADYFIHPNCIVPYPTLPSLSILLYLSACLSV